MIRRPRQGDELLQLILSAVLIFIAGAGAGNLFLISFNGGNQSWLWTIFLTTCALFLFFGAVEITVADEDTVMEWRAYSAVFAFATLLTSQMVYLVVAVGACHYTGMRLGHYVKNWRQKSRRR